MTTSSFPWRSAVVTGASSGIGAAIARVLAGRGVESIVLVARRAGALEALATELTETHSTSVEIVAADLVAPDDLRRVEARLVDGGPPIDLLVNNAGVATAGPFFRLDPAGEEREIALNVNAVVRLTRAALPGMVDRKRGGVLNISSMAANQPSPGMATYSATKAFVTLFSESLFEELRGTGVAVTAVLPGYTRTEFQSHVGETNFDNAPAFAWMSAEQVATEALESAAAGKALCIPGRLYRIANALESPLPRSARRRLIGKASKFNLD